jgi:hypothetical protein
MSAAKEKTAEAVESRALKGFQAQALFPGKTSVRMCDVARVLGISVQQVLNLIEQHHDTDGASGLAAIDVASGLHSRHNPLGGTLRRSQWRIPVAAFDAFVQARKNQQPVRIGGRRKNSNREDA